MCKKVADKSCHSTNKTSITPATQSEQKSYAIAKNKTK